MGEAQPRRALVLGGTGAVGSRVLRELADRSVDTTFTYHRSGERGAALARDLGMRAVQVDLTDADALGELLEDLERQGLSPDLLIHCAAILDPSPLDAITDESFDAMFAVNCRSAYVACRQLAPRLAERGGGDIVLVGALDRAQSLPIPAAFAASQGALSAMVMALAKELGSAGVRINMVALGLLDEGLSSKLDDRLRADFAAYSALRRTGSAAEAAKAIAWLALDNSYMSGKVVAVTSL